MAFQNTNPFYGSSSGGIPADGGQQRLALDNLIRRELKVGDPNDPKQIADALLNRFKDDPRANAITQEAKGLPFLQSSSPALTMIHKHPHLPMPSCSRQKMTLNGIFRNCLPTQCLKDVTPEIQGWAQAVTISNAEGTIELASLSIHDNETRLSPFAPIGRLRTHREVRWGIDPYDEYDLPKVCSKPG